MRFTLALATMAVSLTAQTIEVTPARVLVDEMVVIRATGLSPNERVAVEAELVDGGENHWTSRAEFVADATGTIDVSKQAPVAGSYKDVSAMGLIWSMMPVDKKVPQYQPPKNFGPQSTEFRLLRNNQPVSSAKLEQLNIADGVQRIPVHTDILRGVFFVPATAATQPCPGVLVLGGSNGGYPGRQAAWLASHGYAALALAYFHYEDLPATLEGIPLEYFQHGLEWMRQRPEVKNSEAGFAVMGTSRGGELALQLGSMFPQIRAVVAYVPANVRHPACCGNNIVPWAWTWKGQPLAFIPARRQPPLEMRLRAVIPVEGTQGPVLMISGQDDQVWSSSEMADEVVSRLKHEHFSYSFENLKYAHAGHSAGRPAIQPAWHGAVHHPISGREMSTGGSAKGDAESSLDAIPKVLAFLKNWQQNQPKKAVP